MRTVAANVEKLIGWNRSMAVALDRAECGSPVEDGYFMEKLRKTAGVLGYVLDVPARADAMKITDENRKEIAEYLANYVSQEVESSMEIEGFGAWDTGNMQHWIEAGLEAYESTKAEDIFQQ